MGLGFSVESVGASTISGFRVGLGLAGFWMQDLGFWAWG